MPFLPLRLAPLVLATTAALCGTATASVLVTVNKTAQRMTVSVDGATRYSWLDRDEGLRNTRGGRVPRGGVAPG
jgi:hypothetical protein